MYPTAVRQDTRRSVVSRGFDGQVVVSGPAQSVQTIHAKKSLLSTGTALAERTSADMRHLEQMQPALGLWERAEPQTARTNTAASQVTPSKVAVASAPSPSDSLEGSSMPSSSSSSDWNAEYDSQMGISPNRDSGDADRTDDADEFAPMPALGGPTAHAKPPHGNSLGAAAHNAVESLSMVPLPRLVQKAPAPSAALQPSAAPAPTRNGIHGLAAASVSPTARPSTLPSAVAFPVKIADPQSIVSIERDALAFVARERVAQEARIARSELMHEHLRGYLNISMEEHEVRNRQQQMFLYMQEQTHRAAIERSYDKFVIFSMRNEPVWRNAARQLQVRNEERLNTTENIYARLELAETAYSGKRRMFQEAADFLLSLRFVYADQMEVAVQRARERRRSTLVTRPTQHTAPTPPPAPTLRPPLPVLTARESTQTAAAPPPRVGPHGTSTNKGTAAPPQPSPPMPLPRQRHRPAAPRAVPALSASEAQPQRQFLDNRRAWTYAEQVSGPSPSHVPPPARPQQNRGRASSSSAVAAPPASPPTRDSGRRGPQRDEPQPEVVVGMVASTEAEVYQRFGSPVYGEIIRDPVAPTTERRDDNAPRRSRNADQDGGRSRPPASSAGGGGGNTRRR